MGDRPDLQTKFENILRSRNVYFMPPENLKMNYPAIRYSHKKFDKLHANNETYQLLPAYEVTLIDKNPDTEFLTMILGLRYCSFDRFYRADNLNHWVFTLYY